MRRVVALALAMGLVGGGTWLSAGLGAPQIWLFGAGLVGLVGIASESFLAQPATQPGGGLNSFALWIAPGLLVVAGLWLAQIVRDDSGLGLAVAMSALSGLLLASSRFGVRPDARFHRAGRFVANLILYLLVFLLFALIYHTKERSMFTATAIGLVALLAMLELLRSAQGRLASGHLLAALVGLVVAETTWALNYWPVSGLVGGAVLLLTFYVFGGLLVLVQQGALDRRMLVEYGVVSAAGLLAIGWAIS